MSPVRIFVLIVAAVAAIGLAFLLRGVLAGKEGPAAAPVAQAAEPARPMTRVLVAKRDLTIGTRLTAADMDWQVWPADSLNPAFITDGSAPAPAPKGPTDKAKKAVTEAASSLGGSGASAIQSFEGTVVKEPIAAGEPIIARKIVRGGQGGYMSVVLTPGMRAMGVSVSVDTGAGGFILPGDRVDVLQAREVDDALVTRVVLRNVRVLAIDQTTAPEKDANTIVGAVATLEVAAADAETLAGAQMQAKGGGALVLALRSLADTGGPSGRGAGFEAAAQSDTISVYRGGEGSEVTINR